MHLALFLAISFSAQAEVYKDLGPGLSLNEIKQKYPNAKFDDLKAAWVKGNEAFLSMTGLGISGKIYLKLSHTDKFKSDYISSSLKRAEESNSEEDRERLITSAKLMQALLDSPLENRLSLDWVRWIPHEIIPLERLESRYGKPEKCDYDEESFAPYCEWKSKGVYAALVDNKKYVNFIDYNFTDSDWETKWGIQEKPKNEADSKPKKVNPAAKKPL